MNKQSLKKLNRKELLELLLEESNRIKELDEENIKLQNELNDRKIKIETSGSIAEAVLKINNLFEDAQRAIDDYIYNIEDKYGKVNEKE